MCNNLGQKWDNEIILTIFKEKHKAGRRCPPFDPMFGGEGEGRTIGEMRLMS